MALNDLFFLLGGLGLFLYGISLMSEGLELMAGNKLKRLVEKFTTNKWAGALLGVIVTAIIRSSTATTVMVVVFVNSAVMTLHQAAGVIMGANIGTTLASLIFIFNLDNIAPFVIFLGVISVLFLKRKAFKHAGMILLGFGFLFLGLNLMNTALVPMRDAAFITTLFHHTQNPLIGLFVGFIVVAVTQSSTASIGIIIAMMTAGIITDVNQAVFILYGLNVGTCLTAVIATIGSRKVAKQAAMVHVLFNVIGAVIFTIITILPLGFVDFVAGLTTNISLQLLYIHILFSLVTTLMLLPLSKYLVKAAQAVIKGDNHPVTEFRFKHIDKRLALTPAIAVEQTKKEINRMADFVYDNYVHSVTEALKDHKSISRNMDEIVEQEEVIDFLKKEINQYLMSLNTNKLNTTEIESIAACYKIVGHLERIGDLSQDTFFAINQYLKNKQVFSEDAGNEVRVVAKKVNEALVKSFDLLDSDSFNEQTLKDIKLLKKQVNALAGTNQDNYELINDILLIKILNNLARISGHAQNIAQVLKYKA